MPTYRVPIKLHVSSAEIRELRALRSDLDSRRRSSLLEIEALDDHIEDEKREYNINLRRNPANYLQTRQGQACERRFSKYMTELREEKAGWLQKLQDINEELSSVTCRLQDAGVTS